MAIKIYIDQGHNPTGYPNAGASWYGQQEQDITYEVGQYLAQLLRQDGRFEVRLSRPEPATVVGSSNAASLRQRVNEANSWGANYFISIHANASTNTEANGTEIYVYRLYTQADWLAQHVLQGIVDTVGTKDNGVRARTNLYVLRRTAMPAILVELAYMSNPEDAEKLRRDRYQFALGIYRGMLRYFGLS
ncbi:MAG: N-acetylmuramoyl-L-alanine amidase [Ruminococcaceae bacterium]|nr:N-acetylmuramoyl-L-alanine amidase [Oscillospiraceae bacterium]